MFFDWERRHRLYLKLFDLQAQFFTPGTSDFGKGFWMGMKELDSLKACFDPNCVSKVAYNDGSQFIKESWFTYKITFNQGITNWDCIHIWTESDPPQVQDYDCFVSMYYLCQYYAKND